MRPGDEAWRANAPHLAPDVSHSAVPEEEREIAQTMGVTTASSVTMSRKCLEKRMCRDSQLKRRVQKLTKYSIIKP